MVRELQPARVSALPASPGPAARSGPSLASAEATAPGLLLLIIVVLLIPGTFQIAGSVLSPYRVLLLALFPFLVRRWAADTGGRPGTVDILVLANCLWLGLGLIVGSLWGRAMWLVLIGALMLPPLLVSPAAEFAAVQPDSIVQPATFDQLHNAYQTGAGTLRLDPVLPRAWLGNEVIDLTQREWSLLDLLVRHSGQVVSREDVLAAWQSDPGEGGVASNALEVYVHRLRRKLAGSTLNIRNIRGLGYLLEGE